MTTTGPSPGAESATAPRGLDRALVVTRCDDIAGLASLTPARDRTHTIEPLDLTDPAAVRTWLDVTNDAFARDWTAADHEAAFPHHPIIDVQRTWVALDPAGEPVGVGSVGVYRQNRQVGMGHYLAIRPHAQHSGIGRRLAEHRYGWLASSGVAAVESQTHLSRVRSLRLHFDLGFVPKYRFDSWNSPSDAGIVERTRASLRLWSLHRQWRQEQMPTSSPR